MSKWVLNTLLAITAKGANTPEHGRLWSEANQSTRTELIGPTVGPTLRVGLDGKNVPNDGCDRVGEAAEYVSTDCHTDPGGYPRR